MAFLFIADYGFATVGVASTILAICIGFRRTWRDLRRCTFSEDWKYSVAVISYINVQYFTDSLPFRIVLGPVRTRLYFYCPPSSQQNRGGKCENYRNGGMSASLPYAAASYIRQCFYYSVLIN